MRRGRCATKEPCHHAICKIDRAGTGENNKKGTARLPKGVDLGRYWTSPYSAGIRSRRPPSLAISDRSSTAHPSTTLARGDRANLVGNAIPPRPESRQSPYKFREA